MEYAYTIGKSERREDDDSDEMVLWFLEKIPSAYALWHGFSYDLSSSGTGESLYLQDYSRYRDQRRKDRISDSACRDPCRACSRKGDMPV